MNGSAKPALRDAKPSWTSGIVFVCRECDGSPKRLRRAFKGALEKIGARKRVRVVACACLDVCPKRGTTVVIAGSGVAECAIVRDGGIEEAVIGPLVERFELGESGTLHLKNRQK